MNTVKAPVAAALHSLLTPAHHAEIIRFARLMAPEYWSSYTEADADRCVRHAVAQSWGWGFAVGLLNETYRAGLAVIAAQQDASDRARYIARRTVRTPQNRTTSPITDAQKRANTAAIIAAIG